jgi:hypothetical protein
MVYVVAGRLLFAAMNTSVKWLSAHLHPVVMIWARCTGQLVVPARASRETAVSVYPLTPARLFALLNGRR